MQLLLREFADVFPLKLPPGLPGNRVTDYRIDVLPDYKPFVHWLYMMSPEEDRELNAQLDQYSADGFIEPAHIARVAVTSSARKNDGGLRTCFDCMALRQVLLPRIDELLDGIQGSKVFSKMDLQQGFLQIRVFPEHVDGTAFQTKFESYQFKVIPFGLCNVPATFQRIMDMIFDRCRSFVSIYLDDLFIYSKTTQEHLPHLRQVFSILRAERFYAKPSKCQFLLPNWNLSALKSAPRALALRKVS